MSCKTAIRLLLLLSAAIAIIFSLRAVVIGRSGVTAVSAPGSNAVLTSLNECYPEPPAGQNAATYFSKGFEALQLNKPGDIKLPAIGVPTPAPLKLTYISIVHSNRDALRHFAEGAKYEHSRYPIDLSAGVDMLLPHLTRLKNAALLVQITAIVAIPQPNLPPSGSKPTMFGSNFDKQCPPSAPALPSLPWRERDRGRGYQETYSSSSLRRATSSWSLP